MMAFSLLAKSMKKQSSDDDYQNGNIHAQRPVRNSFEIHNMITGVVKESLAEHSLNH